MATGNYSHVSIDEAITEAKWELGISETTVHDLMLQTLAQRSLTRMNNLGSIKIRNEKIKVIGGEAVLPDNVLRIIAMRYCDEKGNSYGDYLADFAFMDECGCSFDKGALSTTLVSNVMIDDGKIRWRFHDMAPDYVKISFRSRILDKDGFIMIKDYMVEAVKFFICHRFALKYLDKYGRDRYAEWKKGWLSQSSRVVSYDTHTSFQNNFKRVVSLSHPKIIAL